MNRNLSLVFSIFLLVGIMIPAYAQTSFDNVVINEVDTNPPGDDSKSISEWAELYNPTDSDIDLGGWKIASTTVLKKSMTIPNDTIIKSGQFLTYSYQTSWFTDVGESVELRDKNGIVIDKTPMITDIQNSFTSWQRIYDGYNLDSFDDWKFVQSTAGSSNGKLLETQESKEITVTISSDKSSYLFGEVAIIEGNVSEVATPVKPEFKPEPIVVTISGPNFYKTVTLFPDLNLHYKTTLSLHQVLGVNEGNYDVSVSYAGVTTNTNFSVGYELIEEKIKEEGSFGIATDKPQYIPGQTVSITGFATEIIPFTGMKFTVTNSQGKVIYNGNLFPTNGKFATSVFITTVNPDYGTYTIIAEYFDKSALTTFEIVKDIKESVPISLWTDKDAYGLGDEVKITGRVNQVWVGTLDLNIIDTKQSGIVTSTTDSVSGFKIKKSITVMGDGSFSYTFKLPNDQIRLGDYKISISKDLGSITKIIHVVTNPDEFVVSDAGLTINFDKESYDLGDTMIVSGFIKNPLSNSSYGTASSVKISISHKDGSPLEILGLPKELKGESRMENGVVVALDFTAIPETSGKYSTKIDVAHNIFAEGNYVVKAKYLDNISTKTFTINTPLNLKDGAIISLDKEVYGLGETVHLTAIIPTTGSRNADISLTKPVGTVFNTGVSIDKQRFSWSWVIPASEVNQNIKTDEVRNIIKSNFGIYKIRVATDSVNKDLFFKVSPDPEHDSLSSTPLFVSTEKSLYKAGEKLKVIGNVIKREQGVEGLVFPDRVHIQILDGDWPYPKIFESSVYPKQGGEFLSIFDLPVTIFTQGPYTVKAIYNSVRSEATFSVVSDFVFNSKEPLSLLVSTDKLEYHPGDVVIIKGAPNKLIYLEKFDVSVIKKADNKINCGSFICGVHAGSITSIRPSPSGSFTHQFVIPNSVSAVGLYEVTVDADFETKSVQFAVIEKSSTPKLNTIIEKENRIPEKTITILTKEKTTDDVTIAPRVLSGSLITPSRGDESNVNLKVSTATGICIIGSDADCLVKESTRKQGQIYDVVEVDGISLNVRYSGPDVRLEKFSILPESSGAFLPDTDWNVEVLKDDQVSRFYYKVTYKTLE
ncbi:MAG TPA: lamin tail domain-containing protein [Nitrosopumilus sp.]|nr:lamin tail domain-containing protein [Thermoproteota archaeon]HJJ22385.1 lamin tail domain-containing protein [Nitrosopumilus sp.]